MTGKDASTLTALMVDDDGKVRMINYEKHIQIKTSFEAFHRWKDAPDELAFLRQYHRHLFHVTAQIDVREDREIEFFQFKKTIDSFIHDDWIHVQENIVTDLDVEDFDEETGYDSDETKILPSCERFAEWIVYRLENTYGVDRCISCMVSEDNENSSIVLNY